MYALVSTGFSQTLTDTLPHNKNVVIEEFTAVRCSYCPTGHLILDSIIDENPGRIIPVAMYPSNVNGTLTLPYPGSPDLRRTFVNEFFTIPFVHDSIRFFPGAFINRREWNPERREQSRDKWRLYADTILAETSPLNIGIATLYNQSSSILTVDVEVYFTDTVNSMCTLYVLLSEDSIVAEQNNYGITDMFYMHNHVFREALTAQWGDTLCLQANKDSLFTRHFVFDNSAQQYLMEHSHIAVYVRKALDEEIITGKILATDNIVVSINEMKPIEPDIQFFPNPSCGLVYLDLICKEIIERPCVIQIFNMSGVLCFSGNFFIEKTKQLDLSNLMKGVYFVNIQVDNHVYVRKLIID